VGVLRGDVVGAASAKAPLIPGSRVLPRPAVVVGLAAAVLAAFWPTLHNGFVNYDDIHYLTENPYVRRGFTAETLWWALTTDRPNYWHPLTLLSHMVDWQLWGPAPAGHHATNLALHVVNTLLVFSFFERTTGAAWRSALVAALFGLHPLRVESVAWAAERKDVLSTLLWLLTLHAYTGWVARPRLGRFLLVALGFTLGLAAKPMLVTLPLTLLLLDFWPLGRFTGDRRRLVLEKLPLVPIAAAAAVATVWAQRVGKLRSLDEYPLALRLENAVVSYVAYLGKTLWPRDLAVLYPYPDAVPLAKVVACAALLALLSVVAWRLRRSRPYLLFGWLWFLGTLLPVMGLVQVGEQAMADRFTYVPLIGIFVAIAWLVPAASPSLATGVAAVALFLLAFQTRIQAGDWRNAAPLFAHALAVDERNPVAHMNFGYELLRAGDVDAAIGHFERALELRPYYLNARIELGNALMRRGRLDEAMAQYRRAVELDPRSVQALTNVGHALVLQGRVDEAIPYHEQALRIDPTYAVAHNNLGMALAQKGRTAEARAHFEEALRRDPTDAEALNNLGSMLIREGHPDEALVPIERAIQLRPDFGTAHLNRAAALLLLGRYAEARQAITVAQTHGSAPPAAMVRMLEAAPAATE
jgi:tetratricopeptide (TPR) repeat protein